MQDTIYLDYQYRNLFMSYNAIILTRYLILNLFFVLFVPFLNCCDFVYRLKNIHAKRTGRREAAGGDEPHATGTPSSGHKRKRKAGDSDDDEDEDEDSDEAVDDEDEDDEEEVKKARKVETCDEVRADTRRELSST